MRNTSIVQFVFTGTVTTPRHLCGEVGDEKQLPIANAQRLVSEGFGYLKEDGPPAPPPVRDKIDIILADMLDREATGPALEPVQEPVEKVEPPKTKRKMKRAKEKYVEGQIRNP